MHSRFLFLCFGVFLAFLLFAVGFSLHFSVPVHALTPEEQLSNMRGACEDRTFHMLQEERDAYRRVQYEFDASTTSTSSGQASSAQARLTAGGEEGSVLSASTAKTTDLVPYLVLNYHALSCRLSAVCDAVELSHGHVGTGTVLPYRPIGCSRLFSARGRWWSADRRDLGFNRETIPECAYGEVAEQAPVFGVTPAYVTVELQCAEWVKQILSEERQMLRLVVAQDSAQRGTRKVISVLQSVLRDVRDSFLEPLRGMVDLFGSVIHPIPCLLTQCN